MKKLFMALLWLIFQIIKFSIKMSIIAIFFFFMMAAIDFVQINNGDLPVFIFSRTVSDKRVETFKGFFHTITRKVYASPLEPLTDSSDVKYSFFTLDFPIKYNVKKEEILFRVDTKEKEVCDKASNLYFSNNDIKVYTYCLDKIYVSREGKKEELVTLLEKDISILEDIDAKMDYMGFYKNQIALEYVSNDVDFSNQGLIIYRCHKTYLNDVYIGTKNMTFQNDFCTSKNDDLNHFSKNTDVVSES